MARGAAERMWKKVEDDLNRIARADSETDDEDWMRDYWCSKLDSARRVAADRMRPRQIGRWLLRAGVGRAPRPSASVSGRAARLRNCHICRLASARNSPFAALPMLPLANKARIECSSPRRSVRACSSRGGAAG